MKVTKSLLKQIIREEIESSLNKKRMKEEMDSNYIEQFEEAGFEFEDGILGGVGSGGGGYYDPISDKISGFKLDKFNENVFDKWYDNFDINSFDSITYDRQEAKAYGIDLDGVLSLGSGMYNLGEEVGYAKVDAKNETVTLYAIPTLSSEDSSEMMPIFSFNPDGTVKPAMSKEKVKSFLKQNIEAPGAYGIV